MFRLVSFKIILSFVLFVLPTYAGDGKKAESSKATLIVNFIGLKANEGNVKVALANSKKNYNNHKNPFIGLTIEIKDNSAVAIIDDIAYGEYAVKAFHDRDANDDLNTNFLGMPIEDYGFSNDARGVFGPPDWSKAKFKVDKDTLKIEVTIK